MSFDKYMGKDWRKPYNDSRRFDSTCRNHGSCEYCKSNRIWFDKKNRIYADQQLDDYYDEEEYDEYDDTKPFSYYK